MNKTNIKHIFFDLDHTLWDFDKNSALTFEKIFKLNKLEVALKDFLKYYEPINLKYWRLYRNNEVEKEALRYLRLKESFDAIGQQVSDEIINKLSEDYITFLSTFNHLFDDTVEVLEYLSQEYSLHIITNGFHEVQEKKMRNANILNYFKTVTDSEMVGVKKPNPKIFEFALHKAEVKKEESIMIGDSYEADVLGSINYGMSAIWYNYQFQEALDKSILQVNTLNQLKNYL